MDWLKSYNGHRKFKRHSTVRGVLYMTKRKKTMQQECAEIMAFCLEHGRDYLLTVEHYGVSYQQFYACVRKQEKPNTRKSDRRYPEILIPGEKVQVDVKEVPYNCLKGAARRDGKHLYQWTAIDECTRIRFVYGFEEHTPENSVKFFKMLQKIFPFKIQTIQTDNGTEFTYKYISDTELCPFDIALKNAGVQHKLIPPRTPWHNGKVERSHRNDQRYFYNWEKFASVEDLNRKLKDHLRWSNRKPMRTLGGKSPLDLLR